MELLGWTSIYSINHFFIDRLNEVNLSVYLISFLFLIFSYLYSIFLLLAENIIFHI